MKEDKRELYSGTIYDSSISKDPTTTFEDVVSRLSYTTPLVRLVLFFLPHKVVLRKTGKGQEIYVYEELREVTYRLTPTGVCQITAKEYYELFN